MLTDHDRTILDFEHQHWPSTGHKDNAIVTQLGMLPARYAQILVTLIDRDDALAYAPLLVSRLRRIRDARVLARSAR